MKINLDFDDRKYKVLEGERLETNCLLQIIKYFTDERQRSKLQRICIALLSNICFTLINFFTKLIVYYYPKTDISSIMLYRSLSIFIISYAYLKNIDHPLFDLKKIKSIFTFIVMIVSILYITISITKCIMYIRFGTATAFLNIAPVLAPRFSVCYLKDKCYPRHILGLISCLFAMFLLTIQEMNFNENSSFNLFWGVIWGIITMLSRCSIIVCSKILSNQIDSVSLVLYIGLSGIIFSSIVLIISGKIQTEIFFIFLSILTGIFHWMASFLQNVAMKMNTFDRISFIEYLSLVYGFFLGNVFFEESIKLTDYIGCGIIVSFSLYSLIYPLKSNNQS